jgi:hypothetical protein
MNRFKKIVFVAGFILMIPLFVLAQFTESKQISKRYKISPETRIEITNNTVISKLIRGKRILLFSILKSRLKTKSYRGSKNRSAELTSIL